METIAKDYVQYLQTDTNNEITTIEETIENILMRLEEYKGTLEMIRSERHDIEEVYKNIMATKHDFIKLTYRIDGMEMFISRVHQDMNSLEAQLIEAEQDYPHKSEKTLKNLLKPIFSKISAESSNENNSNSSIPNPTNSSFEKVKIFSTDELFSSK